MATKSNTLAETLPRLEASDPPLDDHKVNQAIERCLEGRSREELAPDELAELIAFAFMPNCRDKATGWGTYYGPRAVFQDESGRVVESPSIRLVTPEVLAHWERRAGAATSPRFRRRYADLVWDLSRPVAGHGAEVGVARQMVDATLDVVRTGEFRHPTVAIEMMRRALAVAVSIGDDARTEAVRDAMLGLEDAAEEDGMPGRWGFSFDCLVDGKKVLATPDQQARIVRDLEDRLERLVGADGAEPSHPSDAEAAATRLIRHYQRKGAVDEVHRVVRLLGENYLRAAESAEPMVAASWMQKVYEIYHQHGLRDEADRVGASLKEAGARAKEDMQTFSQTLDVPAEEVERIVEAITAGEWGDVLRRVAAEFLPDPETLERMVKEIAQTAVLLSSISQTVVDVDGRPVEIIGPVDEDLDRHVVLQMSRNMTLEAIMLRKVLERLLAEFSPTAEDFLEHMFRCPVWDEARRSILETGLRPYLRGDHVTAIHVMVPQVEAAIRRLLELVGRPVYTPNRETGGLALRQLGSLLRDPALEEGLGRKFMVYLRTLLVDPLGWNLRNDICHGLPVGDVIGSNQSDRLLHVLLLLSTIQFRHKESEGSVATEEVPADREQ